MSNLKSDLKFLKFEQDKKPHPSGDKRFKLLEIVMKRNDYHPDTLIEILYKAQETFDQKVNLHPGETTSDGQLSLTTAPCMGACSMDPAVMFDGQVCGQQTPETVLEKVKDFTESKPNFSEEAQ